MAQLYAVRFKLSDGEHIAKLVLSKRDDQLARFKAGRIFKRVQILSIQATDHEAYQKMVQEVIARNPGRVPIDELTGGQPNRVLHDPTLVEDDTSKLA